MDILTHTFSGVAVASLGVSVLPFESKERFKYLILGGFVGAFPDIDAVSMWSKWDAVFGTTQKGSEIYTDNHWYSHHGFFHSLLAGLILVSLIFLVQKSILKTHFKKKHFWMLGFLSLGFCAHLLEDMPTPHSAWGGVRLFFPLEAYVGGYGKIWWWNNYDLFLIVFLMILFNVCWSHVPYLKDKTRHAMHIIVSCGLGLLMIYQVNTRKYTYAYKGDSSRYAQFEKESKLEQREILGENLFKLMSFLDSKLPVHF